MRKLLVVLVALALCLQVFSGTVVYGAGEKVKDYNHEVTSKSDKPITSIRRMRLLI